MHHRPHNAKFLVDRVFRGLLQILVSVGGFPIDVSGDAIVLLDHMTGEAIVFSCLLLNTILLLVYVLKQLVSMFFFCDYPSVIQALAPGLGSMWSFADGFLLEFLHEEVNENWREGRHHNHDIDLFVDRTVEPEVCCVYYHLK